MSQFQDISHLPQRRSDLSTFICVIIPSIIVYILHLIPSIVHGTPIWGAIDVAYYYLVQQAYIAGDVDTLTYPWLPGMPYITTAIALIGNIDSISALTYLNPIAPALVTLLTASIAHMLYGKKWITLFSGLLIALAPLHLSTELYHYHRMLFGEIAFLGVILTLSLFERKYMWLMRMQSSTSSFFNDMRNSMVWAVCLSLFLVAAVYTHQLTAGISVSVIILWVVVIFVGSKVLKINKWGEWVAHPWLGIILMTFIPLGIVGVIILASQFLKGLYVAPLFTLTGVAGYLPPTESVALFTVISFLGFLSLSGKLQPLLIVLGFMGIGAIMNYIVEGLVFERTLLFLELSASLLAPSLLLRFNRGYSTLIGVAILLILTPFVIQTEVGLLSATSEVGITEVELYGVVATSEGTVMTSEDMVPWVSAFTGRPATSFDIGCNGWQGVIIDVSSPPQCSGLSLLNNKVGVVDGVAFYIPQHLTLT
ncbi:MAG: hypothetical protein ACXQS2_00715 [Methermicoccaceae archaeon]